MRLTKEALSIKVVVRRAKRGTKPFVWEINSESMVEPVYVSPETFASMEAAYTAGQARLPEFIQPPLSSQAIENQSWQTRQNYPAVGDAMAFTEANQASFGA